MIATSSAKHSARGMPDELNGRSASRAYLRSNPTLALERRWRPANTSIIIIDMQTDFSRRGRYVDEMGYDLSLRGAYPDRSKTLLAATRERAFTSCTHAKAIGRIWRIFRKTNDGAAGGSAPESEIPDRAAESSPEANPAGKSFRRIAPLDGEAVIDKPGKGSFYATDLDMLLRRANSEHRFCRHYHRRLRSHDDARGQ